MCDSSEILRQLEQWGADVKDALERMLNNEQMYMKFLLKETVDPNVPDLKKAIDEGDVVQAFEMAHSVKGVLGNLGLKPAYEKIAAMVEILRRGSFEGILEMYYDFFACFNEYARIVTQ